MSSRPSAATATLASLPSGFTVHRSPDVCLNTMSPFGDVVVMPEPMAMAPAVRTVSRARVARTMTARGTAPSRARVSIVIHLSAVAQPGR
jgi:hypothetical protein